MCSFQLAAARLVDSFGILRNVMEQNTGPSAMLWASLVAIIALTKFAIA